MQLRFIKLFTLVIGSALFFTACSKSSEEAGMIPKDASFVGHVDGKKIQSKLPWSEVKNNALFTSVLKDTSLNAFVKSLLDNPENSGIDINGNMYAFMKTDSMGAYLALIGTVKDADKFADFSKEITSNSNPPGKEDGISTLANEKILSSWKDQRFLILVDVPEAKDIEGMVDMSKPEVERKSPAELPSRNLQSLALSLYDLNKKESLASDDRFAEMKNSNGDLHVWINAEAINEQATSAMQMGPMSMLNLNKLYSGYILTFTVNYEAGKILVASKSYAGKEVTEIWKKYTGTKIDGDMITRLPQKDIAAVFAVNIDPQFIVELLKLSGLDGLVNMGLGQVGITLEDFVKANKGDFVLSISDLNVNENGSLEPFILFGTKIGDAAAMDKIVKIFEPGNGMPLDSTIHVTKGFKHLAISNNKQVADQFAAGTVNNKFDFYNNLSESALAGFVDIQNILGKLKQLPMIQNDSLQLASVLASEKTFENVIFSGGVFNNGGLIQNMEINFVNKDTNSLKQLNNYMEEMYRISQIKPNFNDSLFAE